MSQHVRHRISSLCHRADGTSRGYIPAGDGHQEKGRKKKDAVEPMLPLIGETPQNMVRMGNKEKIIF